MQKVANEREGGTKINNIPSTSTHELKIYRKEKINKQKPCKWLVFIFCYSHQTILWYLVIGWINWINFSYKWEISTSQLWKHILKVLYHQQNVFFSKEKIFLILFVTYRFKDEIQKCCAFINHFLHSGHIEAPVMLVIKNIISIHVKILDNSVGSTS